MATTKYKLKDLTRAVEQVESGGDPDAVSPKGARGRMQVLPSTAKDPGFGVTAARDSSEKEYTRVGKDYLKAMVKRYGPEAGLVAYNWGPGNAEKWIRGGRDKSKLPDETRNYLIKVDNQVNKPIKGGRKTAMASKSDILKRIKSHKKGKSTWQDDNRLDTWKKAGQGSRLQKHGYERALRNMQRSAQQGHSFNKVDAEIVSSYVKETPEQLLKKSGDFANLMMWLPIAGGAPSVVKGAVALGTKAFRAGLSPAARKAAEAAAKKSAAAAKKAAAAAAKKSAAAAKKLAAQSAKAAPPTARAVLPAAKEAAKAAKEGISKITGRGTKKAATAGKEAANLKRRAERARKAAEAKKRMEIFRRVGESGRVPANMEKVVAAAGARAAAKVTATHTARQTAATAARQAKNLKGRQIAGAAALAAVPATVAGVKALSGDRKTEKKKVEPPRPKRKPARVTGIASALPDREDAAKETDKIKRTGGQTPPSVRERDRQPKRLSPAAKEKELGFWEGGIRNIDLPLFGEVEFKSRPEDFPDKDRDEGGVTHDRKGGQIKKGMKKAKAKPRKAKAKTRKRAALRGFRAELRGG